MGRILFLGPRGSFPLKALVCPKASAKGISNAHFHGLLAKYKYNQKVKFKAITNI